MFGNEWEDASFFDKWTYRMANNILHKGMTKPLEFDDMLRIPHKDTAAEMGSSLRDYYMTSKKVRLDNFE